MELWQRFIQNNDITYQHLSTLIKIMISIPPNTGWVERAYSLLELICQKRRNQLAIESLMSLFFLSVLKLPIRDAFSYNKEIDKM